MWNTYNRLGWKIFDYDSNLCDWIQQARKFTETKMKSQNPKNKDFRCQGTWFPGVRFLKNDNRGSIFNTHLSGNSIDKRSSILKLRK